MDTSKIISLPPRIFKHPQSRPPDKGVKKRELKKPDPAAQRELRVLFIGERNGLQKFMGISIRPSKSNTREELA